MDRGALTRRVVASALGVAFALCAGVALAQAPQPPTGNYGGGQLKASTPTAFSKGAMLIELRAVAGGRLRMNVAVFSAASCPYEAFFAVRTTAAADGTFSATGTKRTRVRGRRVLLTRYTIAGAFAGTSVSGTATAGLLWKRGARQLGSCGSTTVAWQARSPSGDPGGPGATPGGALYGTTSQRWRGPRRSIVLRISKDGKKIDRAAGGVNVRCGKRTEELYVASDDDVRLAVDGTFKDLDRYAFRSGRVLVHVTDRFAGRVGMWGASGTLSKVERSVDRRTGRTLGRCRSGTVKWTAAP